MSKRIRVGSSSDHVTHGGKHRFEHWYVDNQVYFITARCRDRFSAFQNAEAQAVFGDRFDCYTEAHGFVPWVTSLLPNHYHTIGYLRCGDELGQMMRKLHGSVAKLVNDTLSVRRVPFWHDRRKHDYFDGCLRDEKQGRLTYRYVRRQSVRHGLAHDWRHYANTRINIELEPAIRRALELDAFLTGVRYKRYER